MAIDVVVEFSLEIKVTEFFGVVQATILKIAKTKNIATFFLLHPNEKIICRPNLLLYPDL